MCETNAGVVDVDAACGLPLLFGAWPAPAPFAPPCDCGVACTGGGAAACPRCPRRARVDASPSAATAIGRTVMNRYRIPVTSTGVYAKSMPRAPPPPPQEILDFRQSCGFAASAELRK